MNQKVNIIFHSADLDGHCSGVVCYMGLMAQGYMPEQINLIPWNYGQPVPAFIAGEDYVVVDVSFPLEHMILLSNKPNSVWIDHHISAIREMEQNELKFYGIQREGDSASLLAWQYYFPDHPAPEVVYWVDRYDVWKKTDKHYPKRTWQLVLAAQFGLRHHTSIPTNRSCLENWESLIRNNDSMGMICADGCLLQEYEQRQNQIKCSRAFDVYFEGLKFAAINNVISGSLVLDSYKRDDHDALMVFGYDPKINRWRISLYENGKDIDLSVIAKQRGGGGHKNACGFEVNNINIILANRKA